MVEGGEGVGYDIDPLLEGGYGSWRSVQQLFCTRSFTYKTVGGGQSTDSHWTEGSAENQPSSPVS